MGWLAALPESEVRIWPFVDHVTHFSILICFGLKHPTPVKPRDGGDEATAEENDPKSSSVLFEKTGNVDSLSIELGKAVVE